MHTESTGRPTPSTAFGARPPSWWRAIQGDARRRGTFEGRNLGTAGEWRRDIAIFGGITTLLAPSATLVFMSQLGGGVPLYVGLCVIAGVAGGLLMGGFWHQLFTQTLRRRSVAALAVAVVSTAALWGVVTGVFGAMALLGDFGAGGAVLLSAVCPATAAAMQSLWFVPLYAWVRANDRGTGWLFSAAAVVSCGLGWGSLLTLVGLEKLFQLISG